MIAVRQDLPLNMVSRRVRAALRSVKRAHGRRRDCAASPQIAAYAQNFSAGEPPSVIGRREAVPKSSRPPRPFVLIVSCRSARNPGAPAGVNVSVSSRRDPAQTARRIADDIIGQANPITASSAVARHHPRAAKRGAPQRRRHDSAAISQPDPCVSPPSKNRGDPAAISCATMGRLRLG